MKCMFQKFKQESGEIAVILACFMAVILLCLGLTVDLGNTYWTHLRMRNAVDLAATAVALQMPMESTASNTASLRALAEDVVERNGIDLDEVDMTCEIFQSDDVIYAARLILSDEIRHQFAALYVNSSSTVNVGDLVYISNDAASSSGYKITIVDS